MFSANLLKNVLFKKPLINFQHLKTTRACFSYTYFKKGHETNLIQIKRYLHLAQYKQAAKTNDPSPFSIQTNQPDSSSNNIEFSNEAKMKYEIAAEETLESLAERFDSLADSLTDEQGKEFDCTYSSGVLNVKLGGELGTYVLNKQTPNLQIWLSSPVSGPKRFDFVDNSWVYKRTGESLHSILSKEFSECFKQNLDFTKCSHGSPKS